MSVRVRPAWIGAFVVLGVALAVGGVLVTGKRSLSKNTIELVSFFPRSVSGLKVGAPVKFRGIPIGEVTGIFLTLPSSRQAAEEMMIPVVYVIDRDLLAERGARGAIIGDLNDPTSWQKLFDLGFRAELAVESFVTGTRFISFDLHPDSPMRFVRDSVTRRIEVPSFSSGGIEEIQEKIGALIDNLGKADLVSLVASLNQLATTANDLVDSPRTDRMILGVDSTLIAVKSMMQRLDRLTANLEPDAKPLLEDVRATMTELRTTLQDGRTTLESLRAAVDPGSPSAERLSETLAEFERMARSLRALSEYLERNPGALLRGRAPQPPKEKKP
jgi:paraquat-inducible protein B